MLKAQTLSFHYPESRLFVIDHASLTVGSGEVVGLSGKSGCGKTTLAKLLAGYLVPTNGHVLIDDKPLPRSGYHPVQLVCQHAEKALNPYWKIKKSLAEVRGYYPDAAILDQLNINPAFLKRYPHELSGGELQRIVICRILNPLTRFLIADEISGMLDTVIQANVWQTVLKFAALHRIGLLVVSHDHKLLERICSRRINNLFG